MNFLGKFFRRKTPKKSKYLQEQKESVEISFVKKFTSNGGKFLYCENEEELNRNFQSILIENKISISDLFSYESSFSDYIYYSEEASNPRALLINCEFLISDQGCVMVSNHQILDKNLDQLPEILIIMIKQYNDNSKKIDKFVEYPMDLNMEPYCYNYKNDSLQYELQSICIHTGSLRGGHYYAYCKNFIDDQWRKYNDTHVSQPLNQSEILNQKPYCLFYKRIN